MQTIKIRINSKYVTLKINFFILYKKQLYLLFIYNTIILGTF